MATTLRFILLGDDQAGRAFSSFSRQVDASNRSMAAHDKALAKTSKTQEDAKRSTLGLVGTLAGFDDAQKLATGNSGLFVKALTGLNLATGLAEPAVAGLVVITGALVSGVGAAAVGIGALGVAAIPIFKQLSTVTQAQATHAQAVKVAQAQYTASLKAGVPAAKAASAEQSALSRATAQYQAAMKGTPPVVRSFAKELQGAQNTWKSWAMGLAKPVLAPFSAGLKLVKPLLHDLSPLVIVMANALGTLEQRLAAGIKGGGFATWIKQIAPTAGAFTQELGIAIGHIVTGLGGIIRVFGPMATTVGGGLDNLTAKFSHWANTLGGHSGFQSLMAMFHSETPLISQLFKNLAVIVGNVARAMTGLAQPSNSKMLLQILVPLSQIMVRLTANQGLVRAVLYFVLLKNAFGQLKGPIEGVTAAYRTLSGAWTKGTEIVQTVGRFRDGFRDANAAASTFSGTAGTVGGRVRKMWDAISSGATAAGGKLKMAGQAVLDVAGNIGKSTLAWVKNTAVMVASKTAAAAVAVWQKILTAGQWLLDAALDANPISLIILALVALGAAFVLAWKYSAAFRNFVTAAFHDVVSWLRANWMYVVGGLLMGPFGIAAAYVIKHWSQVLGWLKTLGRDITGIFSTAGKWLVSAGKAIVDGLWLGLRTGWDFAWGWWYRVNVTWPDKLYAGAGKWLVSAGKSIVTGLWDGLKDAWNWANTWGLKIRGWILAWFAKALVWLVDAGRYVLTGMWNGMKTSWAWVVAWASRIRGWVLGWFDKAGSWLMDAGRSIIGGLLGGIKSAITGIGSWIKANIVDPLINAVKHFFGIHSPSTIMAGIGGHLITGLLKGMFTTLAGGEALAKLVFGSLPDAIAHLAEQGLISLVNLPARALKALSGLGGKVGSLLGFGGGGPGIFGVTQYSGIVSAVLKMLNLPGSYLGDVLKQMMSESGGNRMAVNRTDINWQEGHPSVGLMQVIQGTFDEWAGPFRRLGPFLYGVSTNALANIYAALNYAKHGRGFGTGPGQVGSMHGYAKGAWSIPQAQVAMLHGGEMVLPRVVAAAVRGALSRGGDGASAGIHIENLNINHVPGYSTPKDVEEAISHVVRRSRLARS